MDEKFTPDQIHRITEIARKEAQSAVKHELNNLNIPASDSTNLEEGRALTQSVMRILYEFAKDYRTDKASAVRSWVWERYVEYSSEEAVKLRQFTKDSYSRYETLRGHKEKVVAGVLGALAIAVVMAIYSHAKTIFG